MGLLRGTRKRQPESSRQVPEQAPGSCILDEKAQVDILRSELKRFAEAFELKHGRKPLDKADWEPMAAQRRRLRELRPPPPTPPPAKQSHKAPPPPPPADAVNGCAPALEPEPRRRLSSVNFNAFALLNKLPDSVRDETRGRATTVERRVARQSELRAADGMEAAAEREASISRPQRQFSRRVSSTKRTSSISAWSSAIDGARQSELEEASAALSASLKGLAAALQRPPGGRRSSGGGANNGLSLGSPRLTSPKSSRRAMGWELVSNWVRQGRVRAFSDCVVSLDANLCA